MSMYRQLWLAIIIAMLLALAGSLLASLLSARTYLEEQLAMKNSDNAAAVALSLSQSNPDPVSVELVVAALFDGGHYEVVRVDDPFGKPIAERVATADSVDTPEWFVRRLPIVSKPGTAQISSGWKQFGTVTLVSHSRFAYHALWNSAMQMLAALFAAGVVGGYLGTLVLRRLRPSLTAVIDQAEAITERRFITIPEPDVPELRSLARAMNSTVDRLKAMFAEEAARLEAVRREAYFDAVTGLANREYFMAGLRNSLDGENAQPGALMLARIGDLAGINRRLGRGATDDLLKKVGAALSAELEAHGGDGLAGRLNGADFALLFRGEADRLGRVQTLLAQLAKIVGAFSEHQPAVSIGLSAFRPNEGIGSIMGRIDEALAAAESSGQSAVRQAAVDADEDMPRTAQQWEAAIRNALEQNWVRLVSFPVVGRDGRLSHQECPLRLMFDERGEWLPAGRFFPIAERLGLTATLDLAAVQLGLKELSETPQLAGLAINLSPNSLEDKTFAEKLSRLLQQSGGAASRLWLELAESGVSKHYTAFRDLCVHLKPTGCKIGIEHFGQQFSQIGKFQELGLDYLKVDASFVRGIHENANNQTFLKGLTNIAHAMGFQVIAEGVGQEQELNTLLELEFDGATGPGIKPKG